MKKTLVVYYSRDGRTEKIAHYLIERLRATDPDVYGFNVAEEASRLDLRTQAVVIGAPVYARGFPKKLMDWVLEHREFLADKKVSVFTVSLNAADGRPGRHSANLALLRRWIDEAGIVPRQVASFTGGLEASQKYQYFDWQQVSAFANAVAHDYSDSRYSAGVVFPEEHRMDLWVSRFDHVWRTSIEVDGPPNTAYESLVHLHPSEMKLPKFLSRAGSIKLGIVPLDEVPARELTTRLLGRFWRLDFGIRRLSKEEFANFNEPGYSIVVSNFRFDSCAVNKTRVTAEMRIRSTDEVSRSRFATYWWLLGPGIRMFMRSSLRGLKKSAEARPIHSFNVVRNESRR